MENLRNHKDIKLVTNKEKYHNYVMRPNFKSSICFSNNLMGIEVDKTKVVMNKPVYFGSAILDLSKLVMYEFHYNYMQPKYGDRLKLCYMDIDSFVYHINTDDVYKDAAKDVEKRFDTSGYKKNDTRPLPIGKNKKVIDLMKDELGGNILTEFPALRPKLYAYKKLDNKEDKRCKGIKKCVVKKEITFGDYKDCLKTGVEECRSQMLIQNKKHVLFTGEVNRTASSGDDDE